VKWKLQGEPIYYCSLACNLHKAKMLNRMTPELQKEWDRRFDAAWGKLEADDPTVGEMDAEMARAFYSDGQIS
jgi:hypothetical protein